VARATAFIVVIFDNWCGVGSAIVLRLLNWFWMMIADRLWFVWLDVIVVVVSVVVVMIVVVVVSISVAVVVIVAAVAVR
jgi:hypothetical protein